MKKDILEIFFDKIFEICHINLKKKKKELFLQIFKFGIVGSIAFIIDYLTLIISKEIFNFSILLSTALGFCISVIVNYLLSVNWVFNTNKKKSKKKTFLIFIIFSIIGLELTELIMWFGAIKLSFNYLIVKIIATIMVMIFNFITRKIFLEK